MSWLNMGSSRRRFLYRALLLAGLTGSAIYGYRRLFSNTINTPLPLVRVTDGIYTHVGVHALASADNGGDIACATLIIGKATAAIIDTSHTPVLGAKLYQSLRALTDKPLAYVINTHVHPDHILGNVALATLTPRPRFIGHHKLARAMANAGPFYLERLGQIIGPQAASKTRLIAPDSAVAIGTPLVLDLGEKVLEIVAWPTAHTDNDITIFDRTSQTLICGDLVFRGHIPTLDGSLNGWKNQLKALAKYPFKYLVPGHGQPTPMGFDAIAKVGDYLQRLESDIRSLIAQGADIDTAATQAGLSQKGLWILFDQFNPTNATRVYSALEWE